MPVLPKRIQQIVTPIDLFSEDSEKQRLVTPILAPKSQKPATPEDSFVFQGLTSPNESVVQQ